MLRKLKFKIVFTNMLLVFVLLLIVVCSIGGFIYNFEFKQIDTRLKQSIYFLVQAEDDFKRDLGTEFDHNREENQDEIAPPSKTNDNNEIDNFISGSAVAVFVDNDGEILHKGEFAATMSDEALEYSISYALNSSRSIGKISAVKIMFRKISSEQGTCISFTDYENETSVMKGFLFMAIGTIIVVMSIVFGISILVASLSIKPVSKAWESQKQFIADASHELKTPLTVILANNNILQSHPDQSIEEQMQWIDSTGQEATRMKQLVEQMLYLAKSESDSVPLSLSDINISDIVEQSCLVFETVAFENNVMIESNIENNIIMNTDSQLFERIVYILVDNATKHSAPNSTIKIDLYREGKSITFKVNNKGDMISEEDLPHIFDRFYKADKARSADSADNGFGLGLSIAKSVTEKLHGQISVTSTKEDGTTFVVCFNH